MEFQGFSPETIDFLWGIRLNNERAWFAEHKAEYLRFVLSPMKELGAALQSSMPDGMSLHVSRIYRDMRMHPSTFYKDSLWMCFLHRDGSWLEQPNLCFEVRPEGYRYGFLFFAAPRDMDGFRRLISERPDEFLALVDRAERESGVVLTGDCYKRPKPCENPALERFFGMKNLFALIDRPPDELLFSADLLDEVRRVLLAWVPLCEFFQKHPNP